jgi:uncharacterized membrane protein YccC
MSEPTLPTPTAAHTALGCQLYNRLGMVMQSYRDWFAEGVPHEWVRALDTVQQVLTQCKREAAQAAREDASAPATPGEALPLFAREEEQP